MPFPKNCSEAPHSDHTAFDRQRGISKTAIGGGAGKGNLIPQTVHSTFDPCCALHEWLVFPPRGSTEFDADAAFSTLKAHAAGKPNSHYGLETAVRRAMHQGLLCGTKPTLGFPTSLAQHFIALAAGFLPLLSIRQQSSL